MSSIRNVIKYIILSLLVTVSTAAPSPRAYMSKRVGPSNLRDVVAQSTSSGTAATSGNASTDATGGNTSGQTGGGSSVGSSSHSVTQAQGGPDSGSGFAAGGSEAYGLSSAEGNTNASGNGAHSTSDTNTQGTADTDTDSSVTITGAGGSRAENPMAATLQQNGPGRDSSSTVCGNTLAGNGGATLTSGASAGNALADAYASQGGIGDTDAQTSTGSLSLPNGSVSCADAVAHGEGTDGSIVHTTSQSGTNADNARRI